MRVFALLTATVLLVIAVAVGVVSVDDPGGRGVLSGQMVFAAGTPAIVARHFGVRGVVRFLEDRRVVATVTTSVDGRFAVQLPPGAYVIVGSGPTEIACDQLRHCRVLAQPCLLESPGSGNPPGMLRSGEVVSRLLIGCFL